MEGSKKQGNQGLQAHRCGLAASAMWMCRCRASGCLGSSASARLISSSAAAALSRSGAPPSCEAQRRSAIKLRYELSAEAAAAAGPVACHGHERLQNHHTCLCKAGRQHGGTLTAADNS